jgi:hypothetical protein
MPILHRLPAVPEGDIGTIVTQTPSLIAGAGAWVDRGEIVLRKWPVASGTLLIVAIMISGAGLLHL